MKPDGVMAPGTRNASIKHCVYAQFYERIKTALRPNVSECHNLEGAVTRNLYFTYYSQQKLSSGIHASPPKIRECV
jgi:hypothetical protein